MTELGEGDSPPSSIGFETDRAGGVGKFQNQEISQGNLQILESPPPAQSVVKPTELGGGVPPPPALPLSVSLMSPSLV